jgi:hypothetical protein
MGFPENIFSAERECVKETLYISPLRSKNGELSYPSRSSRRSPGDAGAETQPATDRLPPARSCRRCRWPLPRWRRAPSPKGVGVAPSVAASGGRPVWGVAGGERGGRGGGPGERCGCVTARWWRQAGVSACSGRRCGWMRRAQCRLDLGLGGPDLAAGAGAAAPGSLQ